jgi:two-component system LytT family response regulator
MSKIYVLESRNNFKEINTSELYYCHGESSYTSLYFADQSKIVITKLLKDVEGILINKNFFRINRNYLVNLNFIKSYSLGKVPKVILTNNMEIPISRRKKKNSRRNCNHNIHMFKSFNYPSCDFEPLDDYINESALFGGAF